VRGVVKNSTSKIDSSGFVKVSLTVNLEDFSIMSYNSQVWSEQWR